MFNVEKFVGFLAIGDFDFGKNKFVQNVVSEIQKQQIDCEEHCLRQVLKQLLGRDATIGVALECVRIGSRPPSAAEVRDG